MSDSKRENWRGIEKEEEERQNLFLQGLFPSFQRDVYVRNTNITLSMF